MKLKRFSTNRKKSSAAFISAAEWETTPPQSYRQTICFSLSQPYFADLVEKRSENKVKSRRASAANSSIKTPDSLLVSG